MDMHNENDAGMYLRTDRETLLLNKIKITAKEIIECD